MLEIGIIAALFFAYGLVSRGLLRYNVTAPMVFVTVGILCGPTLLGLATFDPLSKVGLIVAEVALVIVLFSDASRADLSDLREDGGLTGRLLGIGMPLTIGLGTLLGAWLLVGLEFWEAAVVAAVLAPTDAALGHAVVTSRFVPVKIRESINIEAGLNDGLAIPFLLVFLGLAVDQASISPGDTLSFGLTQIVLGVLTGVVLGGGGGWLVDRAIHRGSITYTFERLTMVAIALGAWALAGQIGGNGFIAAFVAGLAVSAFRSDFGEPILAFAEREGQLLSLIVFFVFGTAAIGYLGSLDLGMIIFGVLALTVIRMLPVAISLIGTGLSRSTVAFVGWFGPRGLASIILTLVVVSEEPDLPDLDTLLAAVTFTVLLSVFLHGLTARPLARLYGKTVEQLPPDAPEFGQADEPVTRKI